MLDHFHIPTATGNAEVFYFEGLGTAAGQVWQTWNKPRGKTMCHILLVGKGGNGGAGAIGAASTAAGGSGGGSGGQTSLTIPLHMLPDRLYLTLAGVSTATTPASYITIAPKLTAGAGAPVANDTLAIANGGGAGGNASGATPGSGGSIGDIATAVTMPLGWAFAQVLGGRPGNTGGTTSTGAALSLPTTGALVTGGTGGGGVGNSASLGAAGGAFVVEGIFPAHNGGAAPGSHTVAPGRGHHGYRPIPGLMFGYGGTGGASTSGAATGAGLVQASGGNGAPGCGGGGSGGALTGSTAGAVGLGGPAFCVITCW